MPGTILGSGVTAGTSQAPVIMKAVLQWGKNFKNKQINRMLSNDEKC